MPYRDGRLILASASPRRRELLMKLGYEFDIVAPDADESAGGDIHERVKRLAYKKALAARKSVTSGIIVGADTLVALDGDALGKPENAADAARMLRALSGREHDVLTGICLMDARTGEYALDYEKSVVTFDVLTDEWIAGYIASGEPMDKAGAYAIQGGAGERVVSLKGSYDNVMGFPTRLFTVMYDKFTRGE